MLLVLLACRAEPPSVDALEPASDPPADTAAVAPEGAACGAWSGLLDGARRGFVQPDDWAFDFVETREARHLGDDEDGSRWEVSWSYTSVEPARTLWAEGSQSLRCDGAGVLLERAEERGGVVDAHGTDSWATDWRYEPAYRTLSADPVAEPTWSSRFHRTDVLTGRVDDWTLDHAVVGVEDVEVPAGTFVSSRLETSFEGTVTGTSWWSAELGLVQSRAAVLAWATE